MNHRLPPARIYVVLCRDDPRAGLLQAPPCPEIVTTLREAHRALRRQDLTCDDHGHMIIAYERGEVREVSPSNKELDQI